MTGYQVPRQLCRSLATSLLYQLMFLLPWVTPIFGQTVPAGSAGVPSMIKFSGAVKDDTGKPRTGIVGITFALYKDQQGGAPLWLETQNVQLDNSGRYTVFLGASKSEGLPQELFVSGEARWLGVQPEGGPEQPRTLLLSVPYALKAGDAATIGGMPPSAFVLAAPGGTGSSSAGNGSSTSSNLSQPPIGGSGTQNFIPLWTDNNGTLGNSVLFQSGSGSSAKTGVNTSNPAATLDVNGNTIARGSLQLPSTGTANASQGFNSQPFSLQGSAFNSSNQQAIGPTFQWQTEPAGNNTSTPSGTLNLLYGKGSGSPSETGLNIASNGKITFVTGQTFPGTGTITGVIAGSGLSGGGTSGTVTLSINTNSANKTYARLAAVNTFTANQIVQANVTANQLIAAAPQGTVPLQVTSTTQVPNLNASFLGGFAASSFQPAGSYATLGSNSFNGDQGVIGNVTATGTVTGNNVNAATSFQLGGSTFGFGSTTSANAFLGFAGNAATTGAYETAVGYQALHADTTASYNTAVGWQALFSNDTGASNVATGWAALQQNTSGSLNTATGVSALEQNTTGWDNTGTGEQALFSNTTGQNNSAHGTIALNKSTTGNDNTGDGFAALFANTTGNDNTAEGSGALQFNTTGSNNTSLGVNSGNNTAFAPMTGSNNTFVGAATSTGTLTNLSNAAAIGANAQVTANNSMVLGSINGVNGATADTLVGIGTTAPLFKLDVHGNANFTGAITFAPGQTFPGTGTITGVTAGTDLIGGGTTGTVTLNVDTNKVVTGVTAGTDLTGGGVGGVLTLNLDTTKVPLLAAANTFIATQTISSGNLVLASGSLTLPQTTGSGVGVINMGSAPLFHACCSGQNNLFMGASSGNFTNTGNFNLAYGGHSLTNLTTGIYNIGVGFDTLASITTGASNVAVGGDALAINSTGSYNTAVGREALTDSTTGVQNTALGNAALFYNTTGSFNTGLGTSAGPSSAHPDLNNATAVGALSEVDESNAMVLGSINGVNGATADTSVGIGTTAPATTLDVEGTAPALVGPILLLKNKAPIQSGSLGNSVDFRFAIDGGSSAGNPNAYMRVAEDGNSQYGAWISFATMADGGAGSGALERMRIRSDGLVGIGTAIPDALLTVNGGADKPGGGSWGTFSDRRLKDLDGDFHAGLSEILKLQPVRYRYKQDNGMGINDREEHVGFVAQDVQKVIPEAVSENSKGYLLVNNDPILWTMLNAIKEQQQQIREQREQIRTQQQQIARLNGEVGALESSLRTVNLHHRRKLAAHQPASKPRVIAADVPTNGQTGN